MGRLPGIAYDLVITPLVYVIELTFSLANRLVANPGLAIVCVSLVVSVLSTPLYAMADRLQREERERQASLARWVSHIKSSFSGDEQYMMLSTYYRQQGYRPIYALRSSVSLLLQIPFFMAAYAYLSNLELLHHASFLGIPNLGEPDAFLALGTTTVNVLPLIMTALNAVSTAVYTRGMSLKEKLQPYGLALVFLVLLYRSPSGLVLYWTCNQVFSLLRNLVPREGLTLPPALAAAVELRHASAADKEAPAIPGPAFLLAACSIALVTGLLIPSALIASAPTEFINVNDFVNPLWHLVHTLSVFVGLFVLWLGVYYALAGAHGRRALALALCVLLGIFLCDFFLPGHDLGIITSSLSFETAPVYEASEVASNIVALVVVVAAILAVGRLRPRLLAPVLSVLLIAILGLCTVNVRGIYAATEEVKASMLPDVAAVAEAQVAEDAPAVVAQPYGTVHQLVDDEGSIVPLVTLSTQGRNVVVLFLDRAISEYVPFIMQQRHDVAAAFDGFTYYPNTLASGRFTVFGSPAIYGGYEYMFQEMNERSDMLLRDKHNEALKVLPTLFYQAGFTATLFDPPLCDYQWGEAGYAIFDDTPYLDVYHTAGAYNAFVSEQYQTVIKQVFPRNLCLYSLFKCMPAGLRGALYDDGAYLSTAVNHSVSSGFIDYYAVLANLTPLTQVSDDSSDNFLIMENLCTHNPDDVQMPDCVPSLYVDNSAFEGVDGMTVDGLTINLGPDGTTHYYTNMAALLRLGEWFDWMREQGVYDNTRIIVVSDHGAQFGQFPQLVFDDGELDVEGVSALLMVKDFGATGALSTSREFMTNADAPLLALSGIMDNPVNPFTGNAMTSDAKWARPQQTNTSLFWDTSAYQLGTTFDTYDAHVYSVHDDIFEESNWQRLD